MLFGRFSSIPVFILFFFLFPKWNTGQDLEIMNSQGTRVDGDTARVYFYPGSDHGWTEIYIYLQVKNTSDSTLNVNVRKIEYNVQPGEYHAICFAGSCYDSTVFTSPYTVSLGSGKIDSSFSGHFRFDDLEHPPGEFFVTYTFFTEGTQKDSASVTVVYDTKTFVGMSEPRLKAASTFSLFPNPTTGGNVLLKTNAPAHSRLEIMNSTGTILFDQIMENSRGIMLEGMGSGIYFYRLSTGKNPGDWRRLLVF